MKKIGVVAMLLVLVVAVFGALAGPSDTVVIYPIAADPCANPSAAKSSAIFSTGTSTTSQVVALTAAKSIYICDVSAYLTGTTTLTTFKLVSGTTTTTACDTGTADVTHTSAVTSAIGTNVHIGYGGTLFKVASANALCSTTTGTSSAVVGTVTYVKQ